MVAISYPEQCNGGIGGGHRRPAAGHGIRHRLGRPAGAGAVYGHRRGAVDLGFRRYPRADFRPDRRIHRRALDHHGATRHRRPANRHADGRSHSAGVRNRAPRSRDQVHPQSRHRGLYGRNRRHHFRRPVEGLPRVVSGSRRTALSPEAVVAHRSLADHQPGDHRIGAARARDFDSGRPLLEAHSGPPDCTPRGHRAAGRFSIQGGRDHWFRLRRNPAHTARVVAALAGSGASPILGGPGVHHRLAGCDRIAVVRRGGGRHGRHPSRFESRTHRSGHCQHHCAAVRRVCRHRCACAHRDQYTQRRHQSARRDSPLRVSGAW